jgi:DNA-binding winged helix-turn-helix (wHTH) protein
MKEEIEVGPWRIRPLLHELVSPEGEPARVEPKSMAVLLALAEEPGEVRTREELLDAVWTDTFVAEEVLSHAVWDLRRALGDDARKPTFIQTIPRSGYRLLAPVTSTLVHDRAPLRVVVPAVAVETGPFEPAASRVEVAALATLVSLDGVVPIDTAQLGEAGPRPVDIARASAADEVLLLRLERAATDSGLAAVVVRRYLGADGRVLATDRFEIPTGLGDARLIADTVRERLLTLFDDLCPEDALALGRPRRPPLPEPRGQRSGPAAGRRSLPTDRPSEPPPGPAPSGG